MQQWIVRNRTEDRSLLQEFYEVQQKLFGNIAWCMYNRKNYQQTVSFCTRVLNMFEPSKKSIQPSVLSDSDKSKRVIPGTIPEDAQMKAKYLYLRGQAYLADTTLNGHLKVRTK